MQVGKRTGAADINIFLERAKWLVSQGDYDFVPRRKNMQALALHGLTVLDAKEEILGLSAGDYYKGPKQDFDRPGEIWEFKKTVEGVPFYIKMKITEEGGKMTLKCLGFHEDDFA